MAENAGEDQTMKLSEEQLRELIEKLCGRTFEGGVCLILAGITDKRECIGRTLLSVETDAAGLAGLGATVYGQADKLVKDMRDQMVPKDEILDFDLNYAAAMKHSTDITKHDTSIKKPEEEGGADEKQARSD